MAPSINLPSKDLTLLQTYVAPNAPQDYFLFTITLFHRYATEYLFPLYTRGVKIRRPNQKQIESYLSLPSTHPTNSSWIFYHDDPPHKNWTQDQHAAAYFMRIIKGDIQGEKKWLGQSDVWPRWVSQFWSGLIRLQDVYMEEWMWPRDDLEIKRTFKSEEEESRMRGVLVGLVEAIKREEGDFGWGDL
ncbi:hypothetical protein QBC43DRAFT_285628 [Cladorrhinum sp. PSN259]|nr:hypothetical protein QBC43DRAFT_285628 [Cladorrhinum sp. PSN259]